MLIISRILRRGIEKRVCTIKMKHVWTAERIVKSPFEDIAIPEVTLAEYIWKDLDKWSNKTALVCGITDRNYTYFELYKKSETFGASLRKKFKIKNGDVVGVMLQNSPEYPIVVLGILSAGGIVTTVNPLYTAFEVQKQIESSELKLIVTVPECVTLLKEVLRECKMNIPIIAVDVERDRCDKTVSYKELVDDSNLDKDVLKEVKQKPQDTAALLYSSGTTGLPKAVQLTNTNIVANCEQQNEKMVKKFYDTTDTNQDLVLAYLPMFHSYGFSIVAMHKLAKGLKLVTLPKFKPETFISVLEKYKFKSTYMAPPTVLFLASNPEVQPKHLEKLEHVMVGAAPLSLADINKFQSKIGHEIDFGQCYGMTEAAPMVTIQKNGCKNYESVGYALPNCELRVIDGEMNNLGPNEMGELLVKGPNVMKGYKNNPDANSQTFVDGWLRTGDLAKIDVDGSVTIADRLKELIKVNAYQVAPAELENIIKEHPAVFDAAVVGILDEKSGQKPKAFVVLNKDGDVSKKDIMDYVSEKVSPYKRLKDVQFIDNIPKNPSGKILKREIVEKYK